MCVKSKFLLAGPVAQSLASPTADPGVVSSILMEIDHEIISTVILLLTLIQEGLLSVTSEVFAQSTG